MVSGGFDPLHIGHVQMMIDAAKYGDVIVVVNSDDWLMRKKGYVFMPIKERCQIIAELQSVRQVIPMKSGLIYDKAGAYSATVMIQDDDNTCIDAIAKYRPTYFANGGDRTKKNVPEQPICETLGVKMLWAIGGDTKPQSSSWLVNAAIDQLRQGGKL